MIDLETLIANKQDELRGRPRDWLDDFKDWRTGIDREFAIFGTVMIIGIVAELMIAVAALSGIKP